MIDKSPHDAFDLFNHLADLPPERSREYLDRQRGLDPKIRREVEAMLDRDRAGEGLIPRSPEDVVSLGFQFEHEDWPPPESIGPYRILQRLGSGAMGIVYLAEQDYPTRTVALKLLSPGVMSETAHRRFDHEVSTLARLEHPGVARIYDAGVAETSLGRLPYFAMERVEGVPLSTYAFEERLSLRARLELVAEICDAVHHAHQKGVVHRDLKPANILVTKEGRPKVLDFGIAKSTGADAQTVTDLTGRGDVLGTIGYMSPEQAGGDPEAIDVRSDIYTLGVILYELLSGKLPYNVKGKGIREALDTVLNVEPVGLGTVDRRYRGDLHTVVHKALDKDPAERYASVAALGEDLRRFLAHQPIQAKPPSALYQCRKFARRYRLLVGTAGVIAGTLIVGIIVSLALWIRARDAEQRVYALSGLPVYDELMARSEMLWPCREEMLASMHEWVRDAEELESRLPAYRQHLVDLTNLETSDVVKENNRLWLHDRLSELVTKIETMRHESRWVGRITEIERRIRIATSVQSETVTGCQSEWREAIESIRTSPLYGGLEIREQTGLVPLGPDPRSGLWEFWYWESGERPQRDSRSGDWVIKEETGLVMILVPGGEFMMGAQELDSREPNHLPGASLREGPPHVVSLDAYFLSKYEVTMEQWGRWTESHKNFYWMHTEPCHPLENVSADIAARELWHLDLVLPTEAQWERACLAGLSPRDVEISQRTANLKRAEFRRLNQGLPHKGFGDSYPLHAPVGTFAANPFGFHDMLGNVWELCRDWYGNFYECDPRLGDGLLLCTEFEAEGNKIRRGGCFLEMDASLRPTVREHIHPQAIQGLVGIRPAKPLEANPLKPPPWELSRERAPSLEDTGDAPTVIDGFVVEKWPLPGSSGRTQLLCLDDSTHEDGVLLAWYEGKKIHGCFVEGPKDATSVFEFPFEETENSGVRALSIESSGLYEGDILMLATTREQSSVFRLSTDWEEELIAASGQEDSIVRLLGMIAPRDEAFSGGAYLFADGKPWIHHLNTDEGLWERHDLRSPRGRNDMDPREAVEDSLRFFGPGLVVVNNDNDDGMSGVYRLLPNLEWRTLLFPKPMNEVWYRGVAFGLDGAWGDSLYVGDAVSGTILRVDADRSQTEVATGFGEILKLAMSPDGDRLFVLCRLGLFCLRPE